MFIVYLFLLEGKRCILSDWNIVWDLTDTQ